MTFTRRLARSVTAVATACALASPIALSGPAAGAQAPITPPQGAIDSLGRPAPHILDQVEQLANSPQVPANVGDSLKKLVSFFRGDGKPGVGMPVGGPNFIQFGWPTIAGQCIGGKTNAVGTAMGVPGPAALPLPGHGPGEVNFVFTGLGTGKVAPEQHTRMTVHWLNINNGRVGHTPLGFTGMNPEGPATINGVAQTGHGTVLALLEGGVSTDEPDGVHANCNFLPTAAIMQI